MAPFVIVCCFDFYVLSYSWYVILGNVCQVKKTLTQAIWPFEHTSNLTHDSADGADTSAASLFCGSFSEVLRCHESCALK